MAILPSSSVQTSPLLLVLVGVFVLVVKCSSSARSKCNGILSNVINRYLLWRYPIPHVEGRRTLPTCPYRFPNGQGDVGKFLDGGTNSEKWEKQHGSIYRIWSGMRGEIVLTRPEQLQAVFKDSDKHFKAKNNNSGYLMSQVLGQCVGLISGQQWKTARIAFEQPFLRSAAVDYVPMIQKRVAEYFDELHRAGNSLERGLLAPAEDLKLLPFWIVAEVFYGELDADLVRELKDLAHTREELFKHVIRGGISRFGVSRYLPTQANRLLHRFQTRWAAFNEGARRRAAASSGPPAPIVGLYELADRGTISKEQLLQTLDESLYANLDVTTGGISWNVVFLAAYAQYQDKLRDEIASAPDREQYLRSSSTLLAACIAESSRLKPLAAFSVPQAAPTTRVVDGYAIPAGTDFIVDSAALNVRSEFWGQDAAVYRPERFLEEESRNRGTLTRYRLWRFGFGPRQCMGKYVADFIIRALLVHLVEGYDVTLLDANDWGRDPECWINHPGMLVRCVRRE